MRRALAGICLVAVVAAGGCGGDDEMTLTEYVEQVNAILDRGMQQYEVLVATPQGEVLVADTGQIRSFTTQEFQAALQRVAAIQAEALEDANAIEPPEQIAEIHSLFFRELPIEALAARAGTAAEWDELSDSPEMAAYRTALVGDKQVCADFQAQLDATAGRGVFADTPWIPGEMKEIVEAAIGCGSLPEDPENMYRPPPVTP